MNINKETILKAIIFDMDGTLYQLDGKENTIIGSTLINQVIANSVAYVRSREDISEAEAKSIIVQAMQDEVGISRVMAQRYSISRRDYFNSAWNIEPDLIVKEFTAAVAVLRQLKVTGGLDLILLTAAPSRWMLNVINYLELEGIFKEVFSGEDFEKKDEVFVRLAEKYSKLALSVGDQEHTDIIPAQKAGLLTLLIKHPNDLSQLLTYLSQNEEV
ncbi:MAG: HAD family hydrolase [bacterium]|nr:HAD family hydrolase [bacterium]